MTQPEVGLAPRPRSRFQVVTPKLAKEWLRTAEPERHRPIKPHIVATYADAMRRGEWPSTGEAVQFDTGDRLLNGRHRLTAIIQSDTPVELLVVRGLEAEKAMMAIDGGTSRTAGDRLQISGEKYAKDLAAAIVIDLGFEESGDWHQPYGLHKAYPRQLAWLSAHPELREIIPVMKTPCRRGRYPAGIATALYRRMAQLDVETADRFWCGVCDGTALIEGDPRGLLRQRILDNPQRSAHARMNRRGIIGLTAKTWNSWVSGELVRPGGFHFRGVDAVPKLKLPKC